MISKSISPIGVGIVAGLAYLAVVVGVLSGIGWDVTVFTGFGREASATTEYAQERLGPVFLRHNEGHDGSHFFVQANDPWLMDPDSNVMILDVPHYRSQRMLYPLLAGGGGLLGPMAIVWTLVGLNVLAAAVGSWAVARLAVDSGATGWLGMAFALNLGFLAALLVGGADLVAGALAFWGLREVDRGKSRYAAALFTLSVLTKEVMLVVPLGVAIWHWIGGRRREAGMTLAVPTLVVVAWFVYVRLRLGWDGSLDNIAFGPPLEGFLQALGRWRIDNPTHLVTGIATMSIAIAALVRIRAKSPVFAWATIGFGFMALFVVREVWQAYWDSTRAVAPLITAFVLSMFVTPRSNEVDADHG
jgi:hypothetical protein